MSDTLEALRRDTTDLESSLEDAQKASGKLFDAVREIWAVLAFLMSDMDAWQLHATEQLVRMSSTMPLNLKKPLAEMLRNHLAERPMDETVRLSKIQLQQKEIAELEEHDKQLFKATDALAAAIKEPAHE